MFGIVANVISDRALRTGAKVWICRINGGAENVVVSGCTKGGRIVEKYIQLKRLSNYRAAWIPEHMRERVALQWASRNDAVDFAQEWAFKWSAQLPEPIAL